MFYAKRNSLSKYYMLYGGIVGQINLFGKNIYSYNFECKWDPELLKKINIDLTYALVDARTKYFISLKNFVTADVEVQLKRYGYVLDQELSNLENDVLVYKRIQT
jgi:hypothetical protein